VSQTKFKEKYERHHHHEQLSLTLLSEPSRDSKKKKSKGAHHFTSDKGIANIKGYGF
jgi:hypothetical protein